MTTAAITAGRVDTIASTVAEREWQIDVAKALAIILVALGHASGMAPAYKLFAYSFHVPLFSFFPAGSVNASGVVHLAGRRWESLRARC